MSLKAKVEAIIYAAEMPITLDQIVQLVKEYVAAEGVDDAEIRSQVRAAIEELTVDYSSDSHGIELRQIAGGYRMSTKPEQHDLVRSFAKSLKPPIRLSFPALETLAVIAYKQPVTVPEISEIRGVDAGGVIATLLDRKLITTVRTQRSHRPPDSVQDHERIPAALWIKRRERTPQHGRIRKADFGVLPERSAAGGNAGAGCALGNC